VILMNAEVDALPSDRSSRCIADRQASCTYTDGDEPGVAMNLFRLVDSMAASRC
jgi:predicted homoserine dehydrogenase-like protein